MVLLGREIAKFELFEIDAVRGGLGEEVEGKDEIAVVLDLIQEGESSFPGVESVASVTESRDSFLGLFENGGLFGGGVLLSQTEKVVPRNDDRSSEDDAGEKDKPELEPSPLLVADFEFFGYEVNSGHGSPLGVYEGKGGGPASRTGSRSGELIQEGIDNGGMEAMDGELKLLREVVVEVWQLCGAAGEEDTMEDGGRFLRDDVVE